MSPIDMKDVIAGKRGVFYGRHSTDKQDMITQWATCEKYVIQYGGQIYKKYEDAAVSATQNVLADRPQLMMLLENISNNDGFVIVFNRDRLARDPLEHQILRSKFKERGIEVVLCMEECLYSDGNILTQVARDGATKYESDQIHIRTLQSARTHTEHGKWMGGRVPFGYEVKREFVKKQKVVTFNQIPDQIEIVRKIFSMYLQGLGFGTIATFLGESWSKERIKTIVTNPFYAGYVTANRVRRRSRNSLMPKEEWTTGKSDVIEPVISKDEWEKCWQVYQQKSQGKVAPKHYTTNFLLTGMMWCTDCQTFFYGKNQIKRKNGKVYGKRSYLCHCTPKNRFDVKNLEKYVVRKVVNAILIKTFEDVPERVHTEVLEKLKSDAEALGISIRKIEDVLSEKERLDHNAEDQVKEFMRNRTKGDDAVIKSFLMFRSTLKEEIEQLRTLIREKRKVLHNIEEVESKPDFWNRTYENLMYPDENDKDTALRRIILYILELITISGQGSVIDIKARIDLETEHQLDMDIQW